MITQQELKSVLDYDSNNGVFTWMSRKDRSNSWNARYGCKRAGCVKRLNSGIEYEVIRFNKKVYYSHRLAWLYMFGQVCDKQIDHIDGNGLNNSISNIRKIDQADNKRNRRLGINNKTGFFGVYFSKDMGKWYAQITIDRVVKHLGVFCSKSDAVIARVAAEKEYGYHINHGRL